MRERLSIVFAILLGLVLATRSAAGAQADGAPVELIVKAGRPLRVALDERVKVKRPGQPVVGTVVEPVYVYGAVDVGGGSLEASNVAGRGLGGFYGLGLIGAGLSQFSRPVAFGLAALGAVQTVYSTIFGMGKNVSFPADTPIQVQLAPGPGPVH